mgnify:CR=1 FL=1
MMNFEGDFFFWMGVNKAVEMFTYIYVVGLQSGIC